MTIVSAFMIPTSPLPYVQRDNPPWGRLADAMEEAGRRLEASKPDSIVIYSTTWNAVLDQLWQTRPHISGLLVDQNWHEFGELPYDIHIDVELAEAAIDGANAKGIKSKPVDYDEFPIDTGTIIASNFLNPGNKRPLMIASNNLYHDWDKTEVLGGVSAAAADKLGKRVAVVVAGGLSGSFERHTIDIREDKIADAGEDAWNKKILSLIEQGDPEALLAQCPAYAKEAKVNMGFKPLAFVKGALGDRFAGGEVLAYEPVYGAGAGVIEFSV